LHLEIVPKVLRPLVRHWCPNAFVISFKLETDESILLQKSRKALKNYGHKLVIANILQSRKYRVVLVEEFEDEEVCVKEEDAIEIESVIVKKVVEKHNKFISQMSQSS
jgi:phosphopantothenate-cysteine ligase